SLTDSEGNRGTRMHAHFARAGRARPAQGSWAITGTPMKIWQRIDRPIRTLALLIFILFTAGATSTTNTYKYDSLGRLIQSQYSGSAPTGSFYNYDLVGNRTSVAAAGVIQITNPHVTVQAGQTVTIPMSGTATDSLGYLTEIIDIG